MLRVQRLCRALPYLRHSSSKGPCRGGLSEAFTSMTLASGFAGVRSSRREMCRWRVRGPRRIGGLLGMRCHAIAGCQWQLIHGWCLGMMDELLGAWSSSAERAGYETDASVRALRMSANYGESAPRMRGLYTSSIHETTKIIFEK